MEHCFIVNLPNLNPIYTTGLGFEPQNEPQNESQKRIIELILRMANYIRKELAN